jgi:putative ABC transport system permease protein
MMGLRNIMLLYRVRLRPRAVQELFAIVGIAVGVGLLFASQIASTSLGGSVPQLVEQVVGHMRLQLTARSSAGFDERLLGEVQRIPGVSSAVPVLEETAEVIGPKGRRTVVLLSTDPRLAYLGGPLLRRFTASQLAHQQAFALPLPLARATGLSSLEPAELQIGARIEQGFLGAVLLESDIGALINSSVAIAPIAYAQQLTGMPGRITSVFVQPEPGHEQEVRRAMTRLAAGRLTVRPADAEAAIFRRAAQPANQSAVLFSTISALVGFLFAFNAILLTVPQRRSLVEDLRLDGYARGMILEVLLFDALVLGVVASLLGLLLGDALSLLLFRSDPGYLAYAFSISSQRIVTWQSVSIAVGVGLLTACIGVLAPLRADIFSSLSPRSKSGRLVQSAAGGMLVGGAVCLVITTAILVIAPQDAIIGIASLLAATLLLLPALVRGVVSGFGALQSVVKRAPSYLAVVELRSPANRARSLAIAATGAIAVFGSVAMAGAAGNLENGLNAASRSIDVDAAVWVSPGSTFDAFETTSFSGGVSSRALARVPGVTAVRLYRGGFLDWGGRRVWVQAPPSTDAHMIPASKLSSGDFAWAVARLREGGWAVVSQALAVEHDLRIGEAFTLPSPQPVRFRVAALSSNFGWPSGAIVMNAEDYQRAWASDDPSAYQLEIEAGASAADVRDRVRELLGPRTGLTVETSAQRLAHYYASTHQSLARLVQIRLLVLIAAVLAMAAAMGAMIWQRRPRLADMKVDGFRKGVLWRALLIESALLLGAGCSVGAAFGIYGQVLLSHALASVTGFPVIFSIGAGVAIGSFLLVTAVAVVIVAIPGYLAARVRPSIILQD